MKILIYKILKKIYLEKKMKLKIMLKCKYIKKVNLKKK